MNRLNLMTSMIWKILIDGWQQEAGPEQLEDEEPGYFKSMCGGVNFLLATLKEKISPEYLVALHDTGISHTRYSLNDNNKQIYEQFPRGLRKNHGVSFGLIASGPEQNCTKAGLKELLQKMAQGDDYPSIKEEYLNFTIDSKTVPREITDEYVDVIWNQLQGFHCSISLKRISFPELKNRLNTIINNYYNATNATTDVDEKIKIIATFIHELELTHPFSDGNCRTFAVLLLNKILLENGFTPCILTNRDRFDAFSIHELIAEIKNGIIRYNNSSQQLNLVEQVRDKKIIYLKDNQHLIKLLIFEAMNDCQEWSLVNPHEKIKAIELIQNAISKSFDDGLTGLELNFVKQVITEHLQKSIYKKAFYQMSYLENKYNQYGIHFENTFNTYLRSAYLSEKDLMTELTAIKFKGINYEHV